MSSFLSRTHKIFEDGSESVFDKIDKLYALYEAAEEEQPEGDEGGEEQPVDPTQPDPNAAPEGEMEGQPADEQEGMYVSPMQKAVLAKTMLDALQSQPPNTGEIPEELLNVTDANADEVIKFIQSLVSLSNALDTSIKSDGDDDTLMSELRKAK